MTTLIFKILIISRQSDFYYPKRAPSGFVGMRGKKAPSGFFGMRGKKYNYNYEPTFSDDYQAQLFRELQKEREMLASLMEDYNGNFDMEKRVPMGFAGVRGKKSDFQEFVEKRVPVASFFGMRGKKERVSCFRMFGGTCTQVR